MWRRLRATSSLVDRSGRDSGAAAVEFALVLPVLLLILFGIVDYGLYFSGSIQVHSGLHDATRQYAITPDAACTPTGSWVAPANTPTDVANLMCAVHNSSASANGVSYVRVVLPNGWAVGSELLVCERTDVGGLTGFVPLPHSGQLSSQSELVIEAAVADPVLSDPSTQSYQDALPRHQSWRWCPS